MTRNYDLLIYDILESIELIEDYLNGINNDKETFEKTKLVQDSIIRRLEIIGEATKNIPTDIREKYPDVPWKLMAGMRDVLIHSYFGINLI